MASYFRGRGHELHSLRELSTQRQRALRRLESHREIRPPDGPRIRARRRAPRDARARSVSRPCPRRFGPAAEAEHAERFERAVSMAACIAWHFHEINSVMQFRTDRFSTPMAPASEIIYDTLARTRLDRTRFVRRRRRIPRRTRKRTRNLQDHHHLPPASRNPQVALVLLLLRLHRHPVAADIFQSGHGMPCPKLLSPKKTQNPFVTCAARFRPISSLLAARIRRASDQWLFT